MKTFIPLFIILISLAAGSNTMYAKIQALPGGGAKAINISDTVVFDLSSATLTATYIDIPVSFLSDDTIVSIDSELKINETKLTYDSLIDVNPDLTALAYFSPDDHFLRFTSYSFDRIPNNTVQISLRFMLSSASVNITSADFDSISVFLNGAPCSIKIKGRAATGVNELKNDNLFVVYPNPAVDVLNVTASENGVAELLDITGKQILLQTNVIANTRKEINIENMAKGVYIIKVYNKSFVSVKKVVINK